MPAPNNKTENLPGYLYGGNAPYVEALYTSFQADPGSIPLRWRQVFEQLAAPAPGASPRSAERRPGLAAEAAEKQAAVIRLIGAYRVRGHQAGGWEPLGLREREPVPDLDPAFHGFGTSELDTLFNTGSLVAPERLPLREIVALVRRVYCGPVGSEYTHITDTAPKRWLQQRLEGPLARGTFTAAQRLRILTRIVAAEGIERYLHTKYVGQKRFSLEGGESLIPALDEVIHRAGAGPTREIVIGMAHRGRLNVLVNVLAKPPRILFEEFEDRYNDEGLGDVKYHLGFSADVETAGGNVHLVLAFNPSHLEAVDPVVQGSVRARQQRRGDRERREVLPVLIHGDAALSGQGVVMETFNMSQARGFATGGTVHLVVNNQIGFTTSDPLDARSSVYCTEVAKMVQAPIFHVNGDDPEAVVFITQLALDYRMAFKRDVVIDIVCYRRHGHNEADEPAVTQPLMYRRIREHPTVKALYQERLVSEGVVTNEEVRVMEESYRNALDEERVVVDNYVADAKHEHTVDWTPFLATQWTEPCDTTIEQGVLRRLSTRLHRIPQGFELHPRVLRILEDRKKMAAGALPVDWGFAETMAYATLLKAGYPVRLSGQDCGRGTFFHRHAVLHNQKDGSQHVPLQHLAKRQAAFTVIDSLLSEQAVLGFEYGYATAEPNTLVIWEAQFGDFANGAQVVIDQFIISGQEKWQRLCALVLMLPHGFEGQGPEHSSARLERYLQLCAGYNIQVCVPTTPAQMFHLLRRQVIRRFRRPLIIMSPKSLLRYKPAMSKLEDLTQGAFRLVIGEQDELDPAQVSRVVLCSGKVYYELYEERRTRQLGNIAIIRLEQLYPFPKDAFLAELNRFPAAREVVWCQEEPRNQGVWYQSQHHLFDCVRADQDLAFAGRPPSASPASGYYGRHVELQREVIWDALGIKQGLSVVPAKQKSGSR